MAIILDRYQFLNKNCTCGKALKAFLVDPTGERCAPVGPPYTVPDPQVNWFLVVAFSKEEAFAYVKGEKTEHDVYSNPAHMKGAVSRKLGICLPVTQQIGLSTRRIASKVEPEAQFPQEVMKELERIEMAAVARLRPGFLPICESCPNRCSPISRTVACSIAKVDCFGDLSGSQPFTFVLKGKWICQRD